VVSTQINQHKSITNQSQIKKVKRTMEKTVATNPLPERLTVAESTKCQAEAAEGVGHLPWINPW